jgi:hypothetical protein
MPFLDGLLSLKPCSAACGKRVDGKLVAKNA